MTTHARCLAVSLTVICSITAGSSLAQSPMPANAPTGVAGEAASQAGRPAHKPHSAKHKKNEAPEADNEGDPSMNDLIAATIQSANAEAAMPPRVHVCTQADVAMHGRCQYFNQQYSERFSCPPVPTEYKAWNVARVGPDIWTTSAGGRSWHLTKTSGKVKELGTVFRASHFAFDVHPDNPCAR